MMEHSSLIHQGLAVWLVMVLSRCTPEVSGSEMLGTQDTGTHMLGTSETSSQMLGSSVTSSHMLRTSETTLLAALGAMETTSHTPPLLVTSEAKSQTLEMSDAIAPTIGTSETHSPTLVSTETHSSSLGTVETHSPSLESSETYSSSLRTSETILPTITSSAVSLSMFNTGSSQHSSLASVQSNSRIIATLPTTISVEGFVSVSSSAFPVNWTTTLQSLSLDHSLSTSAISVLTHASTSAHISGTESPSILNITEGRTSAMSESSTAIVPSASLRSDSQTKSDEETIPTSASSISRTTALGISFTSTVTGPSASVTQSFWSQSHVIRPTSHSSLLSRTPSSIQTSASISTSGETLVKSEATPSDESIATGLESFVLSSHIHTSYILERSVSYSKSFPSTYEQSTRISSSRSSVMTRSIRPTRQTSMSYPSAPTTNYIYPSVPSSTLLPESRTNITTSTSNLVTSVIQTLTHSPNTTSNAKDTVKTIRLMIQFSGDCEKVDGKEIMEAEFWLEFVDVLKRSTYIKLRSNQIRLGGFAYTPFRVIVVIETVKSDMFISELNETIHNGDFEVPVLHTNRMLTYIAEGLSVSPISEDIGKDITEARQSLDTADIAIIALASVLFAIFIFIGSIVLCRECYMRKRAASFNLVDKPIINTKMSDFELIKIPRPKMIYHNRSGTTAPSPAANGKPKPPKRRAPNPDVDRVRVRSDNLNVRMSDHRDGLIVGVTGMILEAEAESRSDFDSLSSTGRDMSKVTLLKGDNSYDSSNGLTNPSYTSTDGSIRGSPVVIEEDENEQLL